MEARLEQGVNRQLELLQPNFSVELVAQTGQGVQEQESVILNWVMRYKGCRFRERLSITRKSASRRRGHLSFYVLSLVLRFSSSLSGYSGSLVPCFSGFPVFWNWRLRAGSVSTTVVQENWSFGCE